MSSMHEDVGASFHVTAWRFNYKLHGSGRSRQGQRGGVVLAGLMSMVLSGFEEALGGG